MIQSKYSITYKSYTILYNVNTIKRTWAPAGILAGGKDRQGESDRPRRRRRGGRPIMASVKRETQNFLGVQGVKPSEAGDISSFQTSKAENVLNCGEQNCSMTCREQPNSRLRGRNAHRVIETIPRNRQISA